MRPIKFRGRDVTTGTVIYGNFVYDAVGKPFIVLYKSKHEFELAHVDPDSVAQLVGYDGNGKEVYEGDTVIEEYTEGERKEHIARLESMTQVPETAQFFFFPFPAPFTTLKEQPS